MTLTYREQKNLQISPTYPSPTLKYCTKTAQQRQNHSPRPWHTMTTVSQSTIAAAFARHRSRAQAAQQRATRGSSRPVLGTAEVAAPARPLPRGERSPLKSMPCSCAHSRSPASARLSHSASCSRAHANTVHRRGHWCSKRNRTRTSLYLEYLHPASMGSSPSTCPPRRRRAQIDSPRKLHGLP